MPVFVHSTGIYVGSACKYEIEINELNQCKFNWPSLRSPTANFLLIQLAVHCLPLMRRMWDLHVSKETTATRVVQCETIQRQNAVVLRLLYTQPPTSRIFHPLKHLHTAAFTRKCLYLHKLQLLHRCTYTQKLLHRDSLYTQAFLTPMLSHTDNFYTQALSTQAHLHTESFYTRCLYTRMLLHTEAFPQSSFYTWVLVESFGHKRLIYAVMFLHWDSCLHTGAFPHSSFENFCTKALLDTDRFYTQKVLHLDVFTHHSNDIQKTLHAHTRIELGHWHIGVIRLELNPNSVQSNKTNKYR